MKAVIAFACMALTFAFLATSQLRMETLKHERDTVLETYAQSTEFRDWLTEALRPKKFG